MKFPAINIGHLATRLEFQGMAIGRFVIRFVAQTFLQYNQSGVQFITVDSLNNPRTNKFYMDNLFYYQSNNDMYSETRRMYLPLMEYMD